MSIVLDKEFYTIREACEILGFANSTIYNWDLKGFLRIQYINLKPRISKEDIERILKYSDRNVWVTTKEVREITGLHNSYIYQLFKSGKIETSYFGGLLVFNKKSLLEFEKKRKQEHLFIKKPFEEIRIPKGKSCFAMKEVAEILGVANSTISAWCRKGIMEADSIIGHRKAISINSLKRFISDEKKRYENIK